MNLSIVVNNRDYYLSKEYLDIATEEDNLNTLYGIDMFTSRFTKQDIIESVKRSNIIADIEALGESKLVIKYNENNKIREYNAYTYDDIDYWTFEVGDFFFKNADKKNILNQINNYFSNKTYLPEDLVMFSQLLKVGSIIQILHEYSNLSYRSVRIIKDYIYNEILPKLDEKTLKRDAKKE